MYLCCLRFVIQPTTLMETGMELPLYHVSLMLNCHMFSGTNYVQKSGTAWAANCKYEYYYFNRDIFALFIQYSYQPYIPETDILG